MREVQTNARAEALAGGATLQFVVPASAIEVGAERLPKFEVSGLPGARVALRRGFVDLEGASLHVACVEAPSDRWAPGMEEVVFGIANGVAHRAMRERLKLERLERWDAGSIVFQNDYFEQKVFGQAKAERSVLKLSGKHVLGFEGAKREVVLCSAICDEPQDRDQCAEILAPVRMDGLVAVPPPSLVVQAVFYAAEKPWNATGIAGILGLLVVGFVLLKRPRPKP
jgi:hypothetical protein